MKKWTRAVYQPALPLGEDGRRVTAGKDHTGISKNAAKEGMVLLKNENHTLPLSRYDRVALFGKATFDYVKGGGGSGDVTVPYMRNIYDGLCGIMDESLIFPDTAAFYRNNVKKQYEDGCLPGLTVEPELPERLLDDAAAFTRTAIISISRFSGEGWDRKADFDKIEKHKRQSSKVAISDKIFEKGDFYFSNAERKMIKQVSARFDKVIVVLNTGGVTETAYLAENPAIGAILHAWQGGLEGGTAAAELLMGIGNPSGKLADTFARDLADYPCAGTFYESDDYVDYFEDIYVGYRYFETIPGAAKKVVYPFGYGLSYTTFELKDRSVTIEDDMVTASVTVENTGTVPGKEVVQVYFSAPQGKLGKPARTLAGYRKTKLLNPGEEEKITIQFDIGSMASYDDLGKVCKSAWILEKGKYTFHIGTSVRDTVQADTSYSLDEDRVVKQLTTRMAPTSLEKHMLADGSFEPLPLSKPNDPDYSAIGRWEEVTTVYLPGVRGVPRTEQKKPGEGEIIHTLDEVADGKISLKDFISRLSNEDLADLLGGQASPGVSDTGGFGNNKKYGIPNVMTADGPAGLRIPKGRGIVTTAFPCATLLACSWDPEVTRKVGETAALEVKENNICVWLAPGVNIHRNPLCGRNFEYFSEDPLLCGKQAAAMVRGIQAQGIAATPKHFALNNKETNRKESDSRATERAIREIYIKQFEIIVKEAHPICIMSSYNIINGHRASENKDLLTAILRDEWGYEGMVMTDWVTFAEHYKEVQAGNDLKMCTGFPDRLLEALEKGVMTRGDMETAAGHILNAIIRMD